VDTLPITTPRQAGIYVRQAREAQGITRAALAKKAGVSERLLASLELGDATGIRLDKLLTVFNALGIGLFAQSDNDSIASPSEHPATIVNLPIANSNTPAKAKRRQTTHSTRNAIFLWCLAGPNRSRARPFRHFKPLLWLQGCEINGRDGAHDPHLWRNRRHSPARRAWTLQLCIRPNLSRGTVIANNAAFQSHVWP